jgi:outer membrane immunogenic protein
MKKFFVGGIAALAICSAPALAETPAAFNWTGFYVGAEGGWGWGMAGVRGIAGDARLSGILGGGQVGSRWQNGNWVYGYEGNLDLSHIHGSVNWGGAVYSGTVGWFGTAEGQVGYTVTPASVLSATGGFAFGHADAKLVDGADVFSSSHLMGGWTAGVKYEQAINAATSWFLSYKYVDLGTKTFVLDDPEQVHVRFNAVKVGFNVKFDSTRRNFLP